MVRRYQFAPDPSEAWVNAVNTMKAMMEPRSEDVLIYAYAEATYERYKDDWASRHGVKQTPSGHACIARLLGRQCKVGYDPHGANYNSRPPCHPPGDDHASLWLKDGKPAIYVFQPYSLGDKTIRELMEFCEKWGLSARINSMPSWHFPGVVLTVELTLKGDR